MAKVIVTGSEGLIGKEVARYLTKKGYQVYRCDLKLGHDLTDEQSVKQWFRKHKASYLVNLFGLNEHVSASRKSKSVFDVSLDSFEDYLKINLTSLFSVCRAFAANNKKGSIVNFSSTYGLVSPYPELYKKGPKHIGYVVSKTGVIGLSRYLAVHLAPHIRVNCIAPGGVLAKQGKDFVRAYGQRTPLKRMMRVSELNKLVEYFCSEDSSYTTGAVFAVDGGWTAW